MSTLDIHEKLNRPSPCWYRLPRFQKGSNSCVDELADAGRAALNQPRIDLVKTMRGRGRLDGSVNISYRNCIPLPFLQSLFSPLATWDPCPLSPIVEISRRPRRHTTLHIDQQHSLPEMPR